MYYVIYLQPEKNQFQVSLLYSFYTIISSPYIKLARSLRLLQNMHLKFENKIFYQSQKKGPTLLFVPSLYFHCLCMPCWAEYLPGGDFSISCTVCSIIDFSATEAAIGDNGGHPEHAGTHEAVVCMQQTE